MKCPDTRSPAASRAQAYRLAPRTCSRENRHFPVLEQQIRMGRQPYELPTAASSCRAASRHVPAHRQPIAVQAVCCRFESCSVKIDVWRQGAAEIRADRHVAMLGTLAGEHRPGCPALITYQIGSSVHNVKHGGGPQRDWQQARPARTNHGARQDEEKGNRGQQKPEKRPGRERACTRDSRRRSRAKNASMASPSGGRERRRAQRTPSRINRAYSVSYQATRRMAKTFAFQKCQL